MKKKLMGGFCALLLCLGLFGASVSLSAPNNPCFMAVNDSLLLLEDRFIPIAVNGQYYVPYMALDDTMTGVSLGIFPYYNAAQSTVSISNRTQELIFNLAAGTCTDRSGTALSARAVTRNGLIYVPVRFVCEYFGLTYSSRVTIYGPMVRVRTSASALDDNSFVTSAQQRMADRLREWRKKQNEAPAVTPTPTPVPTPTQPDKSNVSMYLAFRADNAEALEIQLERLDYYQTQALFFFPAQELAAYDRQIRTVVCRGHAVGFLVTGTEPESIAAQVDEGNRLLAQIAHMKSYTVLAADAEKTEQVQAIEQTGAVCWQTDLNAIPDERTASRHASTILANAARYEESVYILSDTSQAGAALMSRILPEVMQDHYALRLAVETEL